MTWQEDTEVVREGIFAGYANDEDDAIARGQAHAALVRLTAALEAAEEG